MKYYQELTLIPGADISLYFLWRKVYQQLHLALVESLQADKTTIGVAFPEYQNHTRLGAKLRIFAESEEQLKTFGLKKWLARFDDYVHITSIRQVPAEIKQHAIYSRYQPGNLNKERLARRRAKRHKQTYEQAMAYYAGLKPQKVKEPFIRLKSLSNGQAHCLFIRKTVTENAHNNGFSSYGLSRHSTVPEF